MSQWQIAFVVVGLIHVALPVIAWTILHRRNDRRSVALWCSGSLLFGFGFMLISMRDTYPLWLIFTIGGPLAFVSYPLRCAALRREVSTTGGRSVEIAGFVVMGCVYLASLTLVDAGQLRTAINTSCHFGAAALLTALALRVYFLTRYRSAALLAASSGLFSLALAFRVAVNLLHREDIDAMAITADFSLMLATAFVAALYGNMGYIGIVLESARRTEIRTAIQLAAEQERLVQTEIRLSQQTRLLEERAELLGQREEMLGTLAHEVRQPLNNALAALTSATHAIERGDGDREQAAARLRRANTVLTQVNSALDNTLADAVLLADNRPVQTQDVDLDTLLELVLGDIDPQNRPRVLQERPSRTRTAAMNAGLMRLALRNVLANALAYSPPDSPVVARISDSDDPLAIVFEVCDRGPGIAPELLPRLFARGVRGHEVVGKPPGHGLGLYIVRRVLELHGGQAHVLPRGPDGGLVVRLVVPQ